jgi:hypothetical protein
VKVNEPGNEGVTVYEDYAEVSMGWEEKVGWRQFRADAEDGDMDWAGGGLGSSVSWEFAIEPHGLR